MSAPCADCLCKTCRFDWHGRCAKERGSCDYEEDAQCKIPIRDGSCSDYEEN